MAFTEFYCNYSTGSNMNGGSDENASPSYAATNGGWNSGTGVFTPASGDPSASVTVGQYASVFLDGATTPVFIGRVTAVNSTTITVSTTLKSGTAPTTAGTGLSINVGGVWKGPNGANGFPFNLVSFAMRDDNSTAGRCNLKNNATYDITATITGPSDNGIFVFEGYTTTPGDGGTAKIDGGNSGTRYILYTTGSTTGRIHKNIWFTRNGASSTGQVLVTGTSSLFIRCRFSHSSSNGIQNGRCFECESHSNAGAGYGNSNALRCFAHSNTGVGFDLTSVSYATVAECVAHNNGSHGYLLGFTGQIGLKNCDAYENTGSGISINKSGVAVTQIVVLENCNTLKNGAYGIGLSGAGTNAALIMRKVGFGAGTMANTSGTLQSGSLMLLEDTSFSYASDVSPWVDPDNGDFRINLADAKNAGIGTYLQASGLYSGGTIGYPDIGAAQHLDAAGASVKGLRVMGG